MNGEKKTVIFLILIFIGGFIFRVWGVNFGLPSLFHFDERFIVYNTLYTLSHKGRLHFVMFYGNFIPYLLGIFYIIYYLILKIIRIVNNPFDFVALYMQNPTNLYLIGRIFFVVISTLSVFALYLLCRKIYNNKITLISVALYGFSFLSVQQSKFMKGDTLGVLFFLLSLYFVVSEIGIKNTKPKVKNYILVGAERKSRFIGAGFFLGLSIASRFTMWVAPFSVVFMTLFDKKIKINNRLKNCSITGLVTIIVFLVLTPSLIFDHYSFIKELWGVASVLSQWNNINTAGQPVWLFYLTEYLRNGIGIGLEIIAILGILFSLYKKEDVGFVIFLLLFWLTTLNQPQNFDRYLVPTIPFFVIFASKFIYQVISRLKVSIWKQNLIISILVLVLIIPNLLKVIKYNYLITCPDTRNIGLKFVESNILPGSKIICESAQEGIEQTAHLGIQLHKSKEQLEEQLLEEQKKEGKYNKYLEALIKGQSEPTYVLKNVLILEKEDYGKKECYKDVDNYIEQGVEYLITSSWARNEYVENDLPESFITSLNNHYELIKELKPYPVFRWDYYTWCVDYDALSKVSIFDKNVIGGPNIRIYKLKKL